jgi:hypothetical protein
MSFSPKFNKYNFKDIFCNLVELAKELQKADEFTRAVAGSKLALIADEVSLQYSGLRGVANSIQRFTPSISRSPL